MSFRVQSFRDRAVLFIGDEIGFCGDSIDDLIEQLAPAREIELVINSNGGDSATAERVFAAIHGKTTLATITERCCSAAVRLAHAARHVRVAQGGYMMIHAPRLWNFSSAEEIPHHIESLVRIRNILIDAFSKRVCEPELVREWLTDGRDHYFTADEAWNAKLVDEIYTPAVPIEESSVGAVPTTPKPKGDEDLFFKFANAFGPVRTEDPNRFAKNLLAWAQMAVKTISK